MKLIAAYLAISIGAVLTLPLVFANGEPATPASACGRLGIILDTIRTLESGGNYSARARGATAAGAYQYVTSTWLHWAERAGVPTEQYPTADSAPPHIQDQVAAANVTAILADNDNQIDVIPVIWYYPAALTDPTLMDEIPMPAAGNTLTIRQYQRRWLDTYNDKLAETGDTPTCAATDPTGQWALPLPRELLNGPILNAPHHTYPALDLVVPPGTPVYAITGGRVARVTNWNNNWWDSGCGSTRPPADCSTCGTGITIQHPDGLRHTYCHNNRNHVHIDDQVAPGQHIADTGNTGRSGTPHLHLELRIHDERLCPQLLMQAIYDHHQPMPPAQLSRHGCAFPRETPRIPGALQLTGLRSPDGRSHLRARSSTSTSSPPR
jgi:murein DD-endopeptidase MepM/ murein hydrolase activator NlpD